MPKKQKKRKSALPDTQNKKAPISLPLQKVGIRQFVHKAHIYEGAAGDPTRQTLVGETSVPADFSMYVDLDASSKGISMSRLPRLLADLSTEQRTEIALAPGDRQKVFARYLPSVMSQWAHHIVNEIPGTENSYIKAHLKIPKQKQSPVSKLIGVEYYDTTMEVAAAKMPEGSEPKFETRFYLTLRVRYISTCPCSLHLAKHAEKNGMVKRGNPHMQPSYATVKVEAGETFFIPNLVFGLIHNIEKALVTIPYPMVKREDEQAIAIACGNHQQFCEDAARSLAKMLAQFEASSDIKDWVVVCDHDESIHSHFATAVTWKGVPGGLH